MTLVDIRPVYYARLNFSQFKKLFAQYLRIHFRASYCISLFFQFSTLLARTLNIDLYMKNFKTLSAISFLAFSTLVTACGSSQGTIASLNGQGVAGAGSGASGCPAGTVMIGTTCTTATTLPTACTSLTPPGTMITDSLGNSLCKAPVGGAVTIGVTNANNYLWYGMDAVSYSGGLFGGCTATYGQCSGIYGTYGAQIPIGTVSTGDTVTISMVPSGNVGSLACFNDVTFVTNGLVAVTGASLANQNNQKIFVQTGGTFAAEYTGSNLGAMQFTINAQDYHCSDASNTAYACP